MGRFQRALVMSYPAMLLARAGTALRAMQVEIVWSSVPLEPSQEAGKPLSSGAVVGSDFKN